eukprot:145565_1
MLTLVIFTTVLSIGLSMQCQYFQFKQGGPAIPCGVCLKVLPCGYDGNCSSIISYDFDCDSSGDVTAWLYNDADCDDIVTGTDFDAFVNNNNWWQICDHITFRSYRANIGQKPKSCVKDKQSGYFEFAFVEGCYPSLIVPQKSIDVSCIDETGFELEYYSSTSCDGNVVNNNHTLIKTGCHNDTLFNSSIIHELFPNIFDSNTTYWEISECGGGWTLPTWALYLIIGGGVAVILCFICIAGWCCRYCSFRKRKTGIVNSNVGITYATMK